MREDYEKYLISVFNATRDTNQKKYFNEIQKSIEDSKVYKGIEEDFPYKEPVKVHFVNEGTTIAARRCANKGHTAILNFADGCTPGGWPEYGCRTQEENICRVSTLYDILIHPKFRKDYYDANIRVNDPYTYYGLSTDNVLYVKDVVIYKDGKTFEEVKPEVVDVITCPAPSVRISDDTKAFNLYTKRIEGIIKSAIINHTDYLVLGAWGCGAFNQNPELIAKAFCHVLNKFSGYFKGVEMAFVAGSGISHKSINYQLFLDIFSKYYNGICIEERK